MNVLTVAKGAMNVIGFLATVTPPGRKGYNDDQAEMLDTLNYLVQNEKARCKKDSNYTTPKLKSDFIQEMYPKVKAKEITIREFESRLSQVEADITIEDFNKPGEVLSLTQDQRTILDTLNALAEKEQRRSKKLGLPTKVSDDFQVFFNNNYSDVMNGVLSLEEFKNRLTLYKTQLTINVVN